MALSVLQLVQEFCGKKTLPIPGAVVTSTDTGVIQIRYFLTEALRELSLYQWQEQKISFNWNSLSTEDQGVITTLFPGFNEIIPATMWDLTLKRPVFGPVGDSSWSQFQAFVASGPIYQYKVFGNHLHIFPAIGAVHSMYVIYQSSLPVTSASGTPKAAITADDDLFLIPDTVVARSLDYRWKRQKGEPWETDYAEFMEMLPKKLKAAGLPVLSLDEPGMYDLTPGIWVPSGSWPH